MVNTINIDIDLLNDVVLWIHNQLDDVYDYVIESYKITDGGDIYESTTLHIYYKYRNVSNDEPFEKDVYMMDLQDYKNLQRQKRLKDLDI
jgi:hypothetical protein